MVKTKGAKKHNPKLVYSLIIMNFNTKALNPALQRAMPTNSGKEHCTERDLYRVCVCVCVCLARWLAALVDCTWKKNISDCICRQMVESLAVVVGSF
jgi:hypothetical protein